VAAAAAAAAAAEQQAAADAQAAAAAAEAAAAAQAAAAAPKEMSVAEFCVAAGDLTVAELNDMSADELSDICNTEVDVDAGIMVPKLLAAQGGGGAAEAKAYVLLVKVRFCLLPCCHADAPAADRASSFCSALFSFVHALFSSGERRTTSETPSPPAAPAAPAALLLLLLLLPLD